MSRFATLDSLKKKEEEGDDDSNEYYAGGADNRGGGSGLSVVGGPGEGDAVNRIIQRARGGGDNAADVPPSERAVTVTFYQDGFTVDDGPLRDPAEPSNQSFLRSVSDGYCPDELVVDGKPSDVKLVDKRAEKYTAPPPPQYIAFSGDGQSIGGSTGDGDKVNPAEGAALPDVNEGEPLIKIQIRFAHNNKRQVFKFNKNHTVQDLFNVITLSEHLGSPQPFQLMNNSTSPPKKILASDSGNLLVDMGLAGGVVIVKL